MIIRLASVRSGSGQRRLGGGQHEGTRHALQPEGPPRHEPRRRRGQWRRHGRWPDAHPDPRRRQGRRRCRHPHRHRADLRAEPVHGGRRHRAAHRRRSGPGRHRHQPHGRRERYANCKTGADAEEDVDCARIGVENSLFHYWSSESSKLGTDFAPAKVITFSGAVNTGCGQASSQVGPFYCPPDQTIYLDTTFFEDVLQGQLGGQGGEFVEPYVIGHEYGHHMQNLLGIMGQVQTQKGPESDAVRLELQADCFAGVWTNAATGNDRRVGRRDLRRGQSAGHHRGPRLGQGGRRRPHPAALGRRGRPRGLDARLGGAADAVVHHRLRVGRPQLLRHVQRDRAARSRQPSNGSTCGASRCSERTYTATLGCLSFAASAPSPGATRASAHSARLRAV